MPRAPFNVIVIPFRLKENGEYEYAVFKRSDEGYWQFIAGGGEDDELPFVTAIRESFEEAAIPVNSKYFELNTVCSVAAHHFPEGRKYWDKNLYVIPNYAFAVEVFDTEIILSSEHTEFIWTDFNGCEDL